MMFYVMNLSRKLENMKIELLREGPIEGLLSIVRLHRGDKASFYEKLEQEFERFDQDGDGTLFFPRHPVVTLYTTPHTCTHTHTHRLLRQVGVLRVLQAVPWH